MNSELQRCLDLTLAEQANTVLGAPQHPAPYQSLDVDRVFAVQCAAVDRRLDAIEVHHIEFEREYVVEATLRQSPMQRHLASLEALDAHAGACSLALAPAAAGLALPGPDAAADAHAGLASPCVVGNLIELHGAFFLVSAWDRGRLARSFSRDAVLPERADAGGTPAVPDSLLLLNHAHEMRDLGDHAPRR